MFTPALAPDALAAAAQRKPRRRNVSIAIILVIAAYVTGPLSNDLILPALPSIMAEFSIAESSVQTLISALILGTGIGCLVVGPLSDAIGRRRVMAYSFLIYAIAGFGSAFANDINTLSTLRFVQGIAGASAPVVGLAIINDMLGRSQAAAANSRAIGAMALCGTLMPLFGVIIGMLLGWRAVLISGACYGLVLAIATAKFLPETHPPRSRRPLRPALLLSYLKMLATPIFMVYAISSALAFTAVLSFIGPYTYIVLNTLDMPQYLYVLLFAPLPVGVFVGARIALVLLRHYGLDTTILAGCLMLCISGAIMFALGKFVEPVLLPLLANLTVLALGLGLVLPSSQVACVKIFPAESGVCSSLSRMLSMLAAAIGMQLALYEFDGWLTSPALVILTCALLATAGSIIGGKLWKRHEIALQESKQAQAYSIITSCETDKIPEHEEHQPSVVAG